MFPFIFFDNLQQKPIALNPFIITFPEVASPPLSSCDHIASQLSPEPVYTFDIVDRCCLGLRSLDHDSFFTSLATTYHSPSHFFSSSQMPLGSIYDQHKRRLYTWTSPDGQHWNQIDYILCSQRWRSSIQSAKIRPGADCGSDHEFLIAKFRLKLKKVGKTTRPFRYDLN